MSKYTHNFAKPSHIFEVKHSNEKNKKFENLIESTKSLYNTTSTETPVSYCFHGTRMENLYPILHMGLLSHMNKVLFK
jgi:hypothetical protein